MAYRLQGDTGEWEIVCGLEVHAQVTSKSKLFSGASASYGGEPNSHVSTIDAGMPGMLPVINGYCVKQAIRTGLGLNAEINKVSIFERKNYFYPDLPQGYQISQYEKPIVSNGILTLELENGSERVVRINRLHLEQDAGKSIHDIVSDGSAIDLNRSGVALMEIVSEPDINSPEEAQLYLKKLRAILRFLGTCDGNMEEGSFRCDANVSVRRVGDEELGTRCEIKNLNSMRFVAKAIEYEAERQVTLREAGEQIVQETRLYDPAKNETRALRSKEEAFDYRYFPDPDLPPLVLPDNLIAKIKSELPELPGEKRARYESDLGLSGYEAGILSEEKDLSEYFESCLGNRKPKTVSNWILNDLLGQLGKLGKNVASSPVSPAQLAELIDLIEAGTISKNIAKDVFKDIAETGANPKEIVKEKGLSQIDDEGEIERVARVIVENNPKQAATFKDNPKVVGWFTGQVMREMKGKANPKSVQEILNRCLNEA